MKEDVLSLILQAEKEYHGSIKEALLEMEAYTDDRKRQQRAHIDELRQNWRQFEQAENEKFQQKLFEAEQKIGAEMARIKQRLKVCQEKRIDAISERLKEEVLSSYGGREDGKAHPDV